MNELSKHNMISSLQSAASILVPIITLLLPFDVILITFISNNFIQMKFAQSEKFSIVKKINICLTK